MNQYQIFSRPRHLRYIFFIDINYSFEKLIKLVHLNQRQWGGRCNPIVPVKDGAIVEGYLDVIKYYDPDYIFYSNDVDPEVIQKLCFFNPVGYYNLDKEPRDEDILGVDALYFVSHFDHHYSILMPEGLYRTGSPLLEFYQTNFGLTSNVSIGEDKIAKHLNQIKITPDNFSSLNKIIYEHKPIFQSLLSKRNLNTKILRSCGLARYDSSEIVIAKDKTTTVDLLYYWNRQLFECHHVIYLTVDELLLLATDKYFGAILSDLSWDNVIEIVSFTLPKEEIEELIKEHLRPIITYKSIHHKEVSNFPFTVMDNKGLHEREYGEQPVIQTLFSEDNLLFIPSLSFTEKVGFYPQKWAIDIEINQLNKPGRKLLQFPLTTDTQYIVRAETGRINRNRNISFFVHNMQNDPGTVEMNIPDFNLLLHQLIKHPVFQGTESKTKYIEIGPHDSSNRMNSFIRTFNSDFKTIDSFFKDKFWVDIFEGLCTSEKAAGDSISFQDILTYCIKIYEENIAPLGQKEDTLTNAENLGLGLQQLLKTLCELGVFLQGFRLKCSYCSSIFWYHLKEANSKINCKGCLEDFNMPVEEVFSYKLNDLIKNNIFQSRTQRDGNLTVIRTLIHLGLRSHKSFAYSHQLNLYDDYRIRKPANEIDVVALVDGKLIIGEAKHNSKEFGANSNKSLNSLIEVAKDIHPDKLILSCYKDEQDKLDKARKYLVHHFRNDDYAPEIVALLLHEPDYVELGGMKYFYY
ncbi:MULTISPECIES: hypothetical protein [unclassified Chryseobacterium]|uniref:hypothetical protein n=1 Tax=unclassified Chryseobacterium TaxID=2593645 RepID=UPI00100B3B1C|nr:MULTISPECIES: hypothetical protein [unclassified Chryseobacterium]RXM52939.1 hypothetical protein BOQ64_00550 [Chryseobacterium sp. CH25]RXM65863.1 hypothetical protein BOQ60_08955 [Chryseobacterium sp. CH1]